MIIIFNTIIVVQVKTVAVDFVNDDETSYRLKIAREIEGKSIKVVYVSILFTYISLTFTTQNMSNNNIVALFFRFGNSCFN